MKKKNKESNNDKNNIDLVENEKDLREEDEQKQENQDLNDIDSNLKDHDVNSKDDNKIKKLKEKLQKQTDIASEKFALAQRVAAEFENYKKRTIKEKQAIYSDSVCETVEAFLPIIDNLQRAITASEKDDNIESLKAGIQLVLKQYKEVLKNIGVEEIIGEGKSFDPNLHNAVMHIEDENFEENTIVEEFQKGYIFKEKVIRHSMVKVAN